MNGKVDLGALVITIEEEAAVLEELAETLGTQTGLLIDGARRPLIDNLSFQEKILRRLGKLEEQRLRLLEELVAAGRLAAPPVRLRELAAALPAPERAAVERLAGVLAERARDIRRLERRNRTLIEAGRRCIDGFLRLLIAPREPSTYGPAPDGAASEPRFFSRAA